MKKNSINWTKPTNMDGPTIYTRGEVITPFIKMNGVDNFSGGWKIIQLDDTDDKVVLLSGNLSSTIQIDTSILKTDEYLLRFIFGFDDGKVQIENILIGIRG